MSIDKKKKLNQLLSHWGDGQVRSSKWLKANGYGSELIQKYKLSEWIEPLGSSAYKKHGDTVDWTGGIACAQNELKLPMHVGGKSALELLGKAQYIMLDPKILVILGNKKELMPTWLINYTWGISLQYQMKRLFVNDKFGSRSYGYTTQEFGKNNVIISAAERAYLEYLDEVPKKHSYEEAKDILENLTSLRSGVLQFLLENCRSLKVKRLFFHLAEKVNHPWFTKLNINKIDIGKGKRLIFKDGVWDQKYRITIPKDTSYEEK